MKALALLMFFIPLPAAAQSGFWAGGAADGIRSGRELGAQERALELDARDGGSRYYRLRQHQQLDAIERELRLQREELEDWARRQRVRGY